MKVVLTGATGFIGRALLLRLMRDGHEITAWVRDAARARGLLGPDVTLVETADVAGLHAAVRAAGAVVNLAGEGIASGRWTPKRKQQLVESRLQPTHALVEAIRASKTKPVFVSASASGYYGDRGDARLAEMALPGEGFAAELCQQWEEAALEARGAASRIVLARLGVVLGREGGALAKLIPVTRALLGGPIGGGAQWMPWVHLDDAVEAIVHAIVTPGVTGPMNIAAPEHMRQRDFARALGVAVRRPAVLPTPKLAVRAVMGEAASVLTASQQVAPDVLLATGFAFRFPALAAALADLTGSPGMSMRPLKRSEVPDAAYTRSRRPRYVLVARTELDAPLERVFTFFSAAENLQLLTPPQMAFAIQTPRPIAMAPHTVIDYKLAILGIPARWRTVIEEWEPPRAGEPEAVFVDAQHRGPYRAWWHEHHFHREGQRTVMEDVVYYAPPLGILGAIANWLVVAGQLRRIFGYRSAMIRQRFGDVSKIHVMEKRRSVK